MRSVWSSSRHKLRLACCCVAMVSCSFWLVIPFASIVFCIMSLGVTPIQSSDVLLSSHCTPFLHLPCLPLPTSQATRSLVVGHRLAYSCLGVSIQFCCFSPCLWLQVQSWPPLHHHGLLSENIPSLLSALSCFQDCGSPNKNKHIYIMVFANTLFSFLYFTNSSCIQSSHWCSTTNGVRLHLDGAAFQSLISN